MQECVSGEMPRSATTCQGGRQMRSVGVPTQHRHLDFAHLVTWGAHCTLGFPLSLLSYTLWRDPRKVPAPTPRGEPEVMGKFGQVAICSSCRGRRLFQSGNTGYDECMHAHTARRESRAATILSESHREQHVHYASSAVERSLTARSAVFLPAHVQHPR